MLWKFPKSCTNTNETNSSQSNNENRHYSAIENFRFHKSYYFYLLINYIIYYTIYNKIDYFM